MRVVTRDSKNATPMENAEIKISLLAASGGSPVHLYSGVTDEGGVANVVFNIPANAENDQTLVIQTDSILGSDTIKRSVTIARDYKVLLTTDKPIYQPGQDIHIRTLALSTFDLIPAVEQDLEVIIADGKGNKVYRKTLRTSIWGIAGIDLRLAPEVNTGAY